MSGLVFKPFTPLFLHRTELISIFEKTRRIQTTSQTTRNIVSGLKYYCAKYDQPILTANQLGFSVNIAVVKNKQTPFLPTIPMENLLASFKENDDVPLTDGITEEEYLSFHENIEKDFFTVLINPSITYPSLAYSTVKEQSISYFYLETECERYDNIRVSYKDEKNKRRENVFEGTTAHKIQQATGYLNGLTSLCPSLNKGRLVVSDFITQQFPEATKELNEITKEIRTILPRRDIKEAIKENEDVRLLYLKEEYGDSLLRAIDGYRREYLEIHGEDINLN